MTTQTSLVKGKDVIGLHLITLDKGQNINNIKELVYDPKVHQVKALIIDEGGWFSEAQVVLFEDITSIGKDAVMIASENLVKKASDVQERINRIVKDDSFLTEDKIITEDGTELGQISDIYFDPTTGKVIEFEVSQGLKNLQSGKKRVRVSDIIEVGQDATIVKGYVEDRFEEQAQQQGVQGAMNTAQDKTPDVLEQAKQKLTELGQTAKDKVQEIKEHPKTQGLIQTVKEKATQVKETTQAKVHDGKEHIDDTNKKNALGKYMTINIVSATDQLLAKRGDMVTHTLLEQAEKDGMLEQVVGNVSAEPISIAQSSDTSPSKVEVDMKIKNNGKEEIL